MSAASVPDWLKAPDHALLCCACGFFFDDPRERSVEYQVFGPAEARARVARVTALGDSLTSDTAAAGSSILFQSKSLT
jgi:hypothetical protein